MNTYGQIFRITSFGESHGIAMGGILDGVPSNIPIDLKEVQKEVDRRKPGQSHITTQRYEKDFVRFLSGIKDGITLGSPISFIVENNNVRNKDYSNLQNVYRPSHADYTYHLKYGIRAEDGGGRSSARETVTRVVAGAIAKQILLKLGIKIQAFTYSIGTITMNGSPKKLDDLLSLREENIVRCPEEDTADRMIHLIEELQKKGDSIGGVVRCISEGVPIGLGEPIFDKLSSRLAHAMMSINAARGFLLGDAITLSKSNGSNSNDSMQLNKKGNVMFMTNNSAGIQGGISNGETIWFDVIFKPTSSIAKNQYTITTDLKNTTVQINGRHDPCIVPRAVPIVEAMTAITMLDMVLIKQANKLKI